VTDRLDALLVPTPWYPTAHNRVGGSFVSDWSSLAAGLADEVRVVHAEEWPGGTAERVAGLAPATDVVLGHLARTGGLTVTGRSGPLTRVPTVITGGFSVAQRAEAAVEASRRYGGPWEAPVLHGHVGYLGGLTAARLADPAARVVVTEHSTGLADFLDTSAGRDIYEEMLERAHTLTCVSSVVRSLIVGAFPAYADRVRVVPNPVDFHPVGQRVGTPERLDRWVFAGGLIERKGVLRLTRAFAAFASGRPAARLDVFGTGALEDRMRELLREAGVEGRATFHGAVPHAVLLQALPEHDVLLAPSTYETFHLVVPEAVAAGVPVVVTRSGGPEEALQGVADLVGRFVDVGEDHDEIVDAVRDLEQGLDRIDLVRAREILDARYGPRAVTAELAGLYGLGSPPAGERPVTRPAPRPGGRPRPLTLVSVSGWRRYAVAAAAETAAQVGLEPVLVTADGRLRSDHADLPVASPESWADTERRTLWDRVRPVLRSLRARRRPRLADLREPRRPDLRGDVLVLDVASFPTVAAALGAHPDLRLGVEIDRSRFGLEPVDSA
jgi:glycosyltransferase involved in cell wall biosynthesis